MDPFYFAIGGFVIVIAIFRREILIEQPTFGIVLALSAALFIVGLVLSFAEADRHSMSGALLCPLISLGLFRVLRHFFLQRFKHEPVDTFLNWGRGLAADRLFNIVYFVTASWLWMFLPFVINQLANFAAKVF